MSEETQPEVEEKEPQADEQQKEEQQEESNPLFKSLFDSAEPEEEDEPNPYEAPMPSSLGEALHDIENQPEASEETEPAKEEVVAEEPQTGEPPEVARPKKKKAKRVKQVIDPEIPTQPQQESRVAFSQPEESEDDKIIRDLIPEEKEYYELAKFASNNMSEHKDLDKEFLGYFKKSKAYVEKRLKDDPYADLNEDQEYKDFIEKNRPKFTTQDAKKIERAMITKQAEEAAEARVRPEVERLRKEQEIARKKPQVDAQKAGFRQNFGVILPEDVQKKLKEEGGLEAVQKEDPLRFQVMDSITQNLFSYADAFVDITQGLVSYDESNQVHKELLDWVNKEQENFIQGGETGKDGKTFMRRERYYATPEAQRTQYYTWSDDDLLNLLVMRAKQRLDGTLEYQQKMLENAGYVKQGAKPKAVKPQAVQPQQSAPQVSPTPRTNQPAQEQKSSVTPMSILGM